MILLNAVWSVWSPIFRYDCRMLFFFPDANNYVLFFGSIWSQNETNFPFQKNDEVELETTAPTQLIHNRARQADCCSVWIDSVGFLWNYSRKILSVDYVYPLMSINESAGWRCETKKKNSTNGGLELNPSQNNFESRASWLTHNKMYIINVDQLNGICGGIRRCESMWWLKKSLFWRERKLWIWILEQV